MKKEPWKLIWKMLLTIDSNIVLNFLENLRNIQKHFAEIYKREPMSNAGE